MGRGIHKLSFAQISKAKLGDKDRVVLSDGGGLYIEVSRLAGDRVGRYAVFRYERTGKRRDLGIGNLESITLVEARERARNYRVMLIDGKDPFDERQQQKAAAADATAARRAEEARGGTTVAEVLDSYLKLHSGKWTSDRHRREWEQSLRRHVLPVIGDVRIDKVETTHVTNVIKPIWSSHPVTAQRVRGRLEKLLGFAAVTGLRDKNSINPAQWTGHLAEILPSKKKQVAHLDAVPYEDCPGVIAKLRALDSTDARALEFLVLTCSRTNEVLGARWNEIDSAKKIWTKPPERMKNRKAHSVPLSDRALAILQSLPKGTKGGFVFTRGDGVSALNPNALLELVRETLKLKATTHGFRSSFSTFCAERTNFARPVVEQCLAHASGDKVEQAYNRSDLIEKRRKVVEAWESFLSKPAAAQPAKGDNVVSIKRA